MKILIILYNYIVHLHAAPSDLLKLKALIVLSIISGPFVLALERLSSWQIQNSDYVHFVVGAVVVDHLIGSVYHAFYVRAFSLAKNAKGLITKLMLVVSIGYLFEGLNVLMQGESLIKDYTVIVMRLFVFLYPAGSAFGNAYEITGGKFPPIGFMNKLRKFTGDEK